MSMNQQTLRNTLQNLSPDERTALITIFYLFHDYTGYSKIRDDDLYTSIPDFNDFDQIHAVMASLKEKHLIELGDDAVTGVLCTGDLNEAELHVLGAIVSFQRAFAKAVDIKNIYGNVRGITQDELLVHLVNLAQRGLVTLDEHCTVSGTFSGAVWVGTATTEIKGKG
jgi:hypothetical protein